MRRLLSSLMLVMMGCWAMAQQPISGVLQAYNEDSRGKQRTQQYRPEDGAFVCENGTNRFTRALYGGYSDYRLETSDRPVFAVAKKNHHRHIRFVANGVALDSTDYCKASYRDGMRLYSLRDHRWGTGWLHVAVVALQQEEGAVWMFRPEGLVLNPVETYICQIANPKLKRNGDIGADAPGVFEASPGLKGLERSLSVVSPEDRTQYVVVRLDKAVNDIAWQEAASLYVSTLQHNEQLSRRIEFCTPDPYINALGSALVFAADGDWDGQTWLHGCIGWRMPLAGWRAAYAGDVLGWDDRAVSHFDAYAKSQVTRVEPTIDHPSQDSAMNMARAEKRWGTQMYSNGYICRNPEKDNQMHHYDMNLNYIDELLWHFQYNADTAYMRRLWPVIVRHLAWEKRNYDSDGDHLYDAYCCIWASDALYYSGGAVTHSSAYNYRGNLLAARIAELIGEDAEPYRREAASILMAMNQRLWLRNKGVWAEYQDALGLRRLHESPAVWSVYTPVDCGACSPEQAWQATSWITANIPHIPIEATPYALISTSNWMPYSWSINNVAAAEIMHTALAYFEAGRAQEGYELMLANILDNMYYGQSPANFGQLSHYDAARGECYRDFGDCIGISSRTLIQGLFGVVPQALYGRCILQPGFPADWDSVSLHTPYIDYCFTRKDGVDRYEITQRFAQPLQMVVRQSLGEGRFRDVEGTSEKHQVICLKSNKTKVPLSSYFNASVDDIFKQKYLSPRPQTTTLQIPVQGVGEWCHPQYTPTINDSVFRSLVEDDHIVLAGIPFFTPKQGKNIIYTSLWDNYPSSVTIPLKGSASTAYLLMAGSTNHMQSRIDNGLVVATYKDGTSDTLRLRNPDNWCPIEQDYYVDGQAFYTTQPRPLRVCLGKATADGKPIVSRNLGTVLNIKGVYGREIPGGAAQLLTMPLNANKKLKSLTLSTLSNDVVIGLMAVSLQ